MLWSTEKEPFDDKGLRTLIGNEWWQKEENTLELRRFDAEYWIVIGLLGPSFWFERVCSTSTKIEFKCEAKIMWVVFNAATLKAKWEIWYFLKGTLANLGKAVLWSFDRVQGSLKRNGIAISLDLGFCRQEVLHASVFLLN